MLKNNLTKKLTFYTSYKHNFFGCLRTYTFPFADQNQLWKYLYNCTNQIFMQLHESNIYATARIKFSRC